MYGFLSVESKLVEGSHLKVRNQFVGSLFVVEVYQAVASSMLWLSTSGSNNNPYYKIKVQKMVLLIWD